MNDETIIDNSIDEEKKQQIADENLNNDEEQTEATQKKKKSGGAAIAVGAVAFGAGLLTPLEVFPQNSDDDDEDEDGDEDDNEEKSDEDLQNTDEEHDDMDVTDDAEGNNGGDSVFGYTGSHSSSKDPENPENPEAHESYHAPEADNPSNNNDIDIDINININPAPPAPEHHVGHIMDVATSVNDSMSFNQAFAAARHEVGAGGLFVWHGHTYGTYYESEWNAMSAEDKEQYWANVHYTTTHLNETREPEPLPEPHISEHYIGHDLEVADNVDDSMSFNEAFAAARHDVGAGGIFVWRGHSYGTYYESEWNAMSAEEKNQYWANVHHTTEHINDLRDPQPEPEPEPLTYGPEPIVEEPEPEPEPEPVYEPEPIVYEPEPTEPEPEPIEPEPIEPEPSILVVNEDDILGTMDTNGDGEIDAVVIDANGNEIPDLVLDTDGDGNFDTLAVDVQVNVGEVHNVDEVLVVSNEPILEPDEPVVEPNEPVIGDDEITETENPDIDLLADNTIDPNIPIDNGSDVSEFV